MNEKRDSTADVRLERIVSAHTPGPWIARPDWRWMSMGDWMVETQRGKPVQVAATCSKLDAHLIAAAPELLTALQAMVLFTSAGDRHLPEPQQAEKVIAKALGVGANAQGERRTE